MHLFPVAGVPPRQTKIFFCDSWVFLMKKWLATAKPDNRGESLRVLEEVSKERITSVADQYFTNLWRVGESQGLGLLIDSEIVLSTRYGKTRVFINKTFSTQTTYQQDLTSDFCKRVVFGDLLLHLQCELLFSFCTRT